MFLIFLSTVRHNVSNTVTVKANEWDDVTQYLYDNRKYFTGVSLIGETGDKDYFQAPNIEVLSPKEMVEKYGEASLFASGLIVDASTGFDNLWEAITIAQQDNDDSSQERKDIRADWIRRFRKFADNYFGGNLVITGYCLKDVYILYKWVKIQNNFTDIVMEENLQKLKEISIDTMGAAACAAGACEI
jgi:ribonucleoside-diphosphate reductase alpha chain